ncbi:MAG: cob(I)yrinic acid a,c-diamide adenosyltransferase [Bacteroidales bacterium]|nr:cob(I)yrinic acid a,c-diamide adenosyltransferase [Bacteroidales bacterium]MCF8403077.1 cob(I)yrinic acid a,c-diamide adenosyltransferase [Bacteroidales bacterium]
MEYKIYTRGGDKGKTSLLGGTRVPKYHIRIEAYGTLDELTSYLGLVRDLQTNSHYKDILLKIQNNLFTAESHLAADKPESIASLPVISEDDITILEQEIDAMNDVLPPLKSFILPGGHPVVSNCHIARTICRRAERLTIKLAEVHPVDELIIKLLNRLSDYLFVLARKVSFDLNIPDTPWKPHK